MKTVNEWEMVAQQLRQQRGALSYVIYDLIERLEARDGCMDYDVKQSIGKAKAALDECDLARQREQQPATVAVPSDAVAVSGTGASGADSRE